MRITQLFLLSGVILPPLVILLVIIAACVTPGYSHISETVSALGTIGRPHPEILNYGLIIFGILLSGFAYGFYRLFKTYKYAKVILMLLLVSGIGIIATGIFQADPKETDLLTNEGIIHLVFVTVAALSFLIVISICARTIFYKLQWSNSIKLSIVVIVISLPLLILFFVPVFDSIEGLIERILLLIALLWLEIISLKSLRLLCLGNMDNDGEISKFTSGSGGKSSLTILLSI